MAARPGPHVLRERHGHPTHHRNLRSQRENPRPSSAGGFVTHSQLSVKVALPISVWPKSVEATRSTGVVVSLSV